MLHSAGMALAVELDLAAVDAARRTDFVVEVEVGGRPSERAPAAVARDHGPEDRSRASEHLRRDFEVAAQDRRADLGRRHAAVPRA